MSVFRRRSDQPRLTPEQAERQGKASRLAFDAFRDGPATIAFLNTHDDALGGRPIDIAIADADGLVRVEQALAGRAG